MQSLRQNEILITALDGHLRAERRVESGDLTADAVKASIRSTNVLLDAAMDCGMPIGTPDLTGWAAERCARFLMEA